MSLFDQLHPQWQSLLLPQCELLESIEKTIDRNNVTPAYRNILAAYRLPPSEIKVVIFGQDPYPTPGFAHGLAFSVEPTTKPIPASLRNIFKEVADDCSVETPDNGDLNRWAEQGVFLLNRVLTTTPGASMAHQGVGWEEFTQSTARILGKQEVVGIFWGAKAKELSQFFNQDLIICSAHPSPLSAYRGFFGSKPFTKTNQILKQQGKSEIVW